MRTNPSAFQAGPSFRQSEWVAFKFPTVLRFLYQL